MMTLPLGLIFIITVLIYGLQDAKSDVLLNEHALIVVAVGTVAVLFFSTPLRNLIGLFRSVWDLRRKDPSNGDVSETLLGLANDKFLRSKEFIHPLIDQAQAFWEQGLEQHLVEELILQKLDELNARTEQPVAALRNLAKYPPALGMTGTVIGMIALFSELNAENKAAIGPALAFAMTATFYGLALANFLIMPLADRLHVRHMSRMKRNEMVANILLLINRSEPAALVEQLQKNIHQEKYRTLVAAA